jgi:hypothetical protein
MVSRLIIPRFLSRIEAVHYERTGRHSAKVLLDFDTQYAKEQFLGDLSKTVDIVQIDKSLFAKFSPLEINMIVNAHRKCAKFEFLSKFDDTEYLAESKDYENFIPAYAANEEFLLGRWNNSYSTDMLEPVAWSNWLIWLYKISTEERKDAN